MTKAEVLQSIAITSGMAGVEEFKKCHSIDRFIEWYKINISFCSQAGKELGEKVINYLINDNNDNI